MSMHEKTALARLGEHGSRAMDLRVCSFPSTCYDRRYMVAFDGRSSTAGGRKRCRDVEPDHRRRCGRGVRSIRYASVQCVAGMGKHGARHLAAHIAVGVGVPRLGGAQVE
jgi:hypothetical protein